MKMVDRKASMENESNNNIVQKNDTSTISEISSPIIDLEIQDIEGIGPTTAKKLKEAGIVSVMDLAVASSDEL
ncbi:MAG TPA: helix-hairpin-helix domain-containing protein, partial [Nitrososphaeraceae archaeon]|nr:helix-hairpin-helix domain-containing protein [Nitrososphaeraceae archaeon]